MVVMQLGSDPAAVAEAFHAGEELALAEVYARWSLLVYSIALASLGNVTDAEEVTQRVFTGAWTSRASFDPTRRPLSAWLIEITRHQVAAAQTARKQHTQPKAPPTTPGQTVAQTGSADVADRLVLVDEMSRLDTVPQQVLRMALYDHLTHIQIAERTGLSPATTKSHLYDSLLRLRTRLEVHSGAL